MKPSTISRPKIDELIKADDAHKCPPGTPLGHCVKLVAVGNLPTRFGQYQVAAFYNDSDKKEHAAFVHGNVCDKEDVPVRIHSECLTGDAIGSLRCDCRDQLEESLKRIGRMEFGILLYLRQEGRGIGFNNKIKAYQLQDAGLDTVDANIKLGFKDDERDYHVAAHMLNALRVKSVKLITNNPKKIEGLEKSGITVTCRVPLEMEPTEQNVNYLKTKKNKSGHIINNLPD